MANHKVIYDGFDTTTDSENRATMDEEQTSDGNDTGAYESATDGDTSGIQTEESSENATMEESYAEGTSSVNTTSTEDSCDEGITARTIDYGPSPWARADEGPTAGELLVNDSFLDHSSGATPDDDEHECTAGPAQGNLNVLADIDNTNLAPTSNIYTGPINCIVSVWDWGVTVGTQARNDTGGNATDRPEAWRNNTAGVEIIHADNSKTECSTLNSLSNNLVITDQNHVQLDVAGDSEGGEERVGQSPFLPNTENTGSLDNGIDKINTTDRLAADADHSHEALGYGDTSCPPNSEQERPLGDRYLKRFRRNEGRITRTEGRLRSVSESLPPPNRHVTNHMYVKDIAQIIVPTGQERRPEKENTLS